MPGRPLSRTGSPGSSCSLRRKPRTSPVAPRKDKHMEKIQTFRARTPVESRQPLRKQTNKQLTFTWPTFPLVFSTFVAVRGPRTHWKLLPIVQTKHCAIISSAEKRSDSRALQENIQSQNGGESQKTSSLLSRALLRFQNVC